MWFCDDCYEKEIQAQVANFRAKQAEMNPTITLPQIREIDESVQIKTDIFNAATIAINELKATIDADSTIENKPFALATELMTRFTHFKNVVFEMNQKIVEAGNQQKAIQIYLNQLANSLRAEERAKLKIADINYKPTAPKTTTVKPIKTASKKLDKVELRKYASELGVSEFTLQMIVVSKGLSVEDAAHMLRRSINEAKS
jgi:DNA integrity scanning protein DisA with diadenylate cyclase activity